jgi:molybdopterin-guanine dinucleotide biosynthesis protein A
MHREPDEDTQAAPASGFDLSAGGFCGVVLAGGTAARMDGIDKGSVELAGRTLLQLAVDAFLDADEVVVVGPESVRTERPVTFTREDPPHGGPVAGLLTGRDALLRRPGLLGVLAVDMPRVSPYTFRRLRDAVAGHDAAFLADADGRVQLAGVLDAARLEAVRPDLEHQHGMSVRALLERLDVALVAATGEEARDVDTWADLRDLSD